ncbi:Amino acid adenylation domain-containing protein [Sulfidibacter corallicola]|uniref:Amino acid adenylation domain-containing protein n=1 Tax=Sulfidibacter corallicola TaxID=2818388 RepID=A0A8A4TQS3_SULCO|nr:non-ribosomal peptide synthetase [Sulfidibacter corallicola]QTD48885.1 amino acid adenylation domain-containing protein [Sulfidibacter corallicola]
MTPESAHASLSELWSLLERKQIHLWLEDDRLRFRAPRGALDTQLRERIAEAREALIAHLREQPAAPLEPLSLTQQRLWLLHRIEPVPGLYNELSALELRGPFDRAAFEHAAAALIQRHQILRTRFPCVDGQPVQEVLSPERAADVLTWRDWRQESQSNRDRSLAELLEKEAVFPFDCESDLSVRIGVCAMADDRTVLVVNTHHLISDATSWPIFYEELRTHYQAFREGNVEPLPPLHLQYADFAREQRARFTPEHLSDEQDYWRRSLSGAPHVLDLPTDVPRPAAQSFRGDRLPLTLDPSLRSAIETGARLWSVTPFAILSAAFATLLSRYSGQDEVLLGFPVSNRLRSETAELIGFFANTLVLRASLDADPDFRTLVRTTRDRITSAIGHGEVPFDHIVEALNPKRDLSRSPLFQAMISWHDESLSFAPMAELTAREIPIPSRFARFDLTLTAWPEQDEIRGFLEYATDLFEASTISTMADQLRFLLKELLAHPQRPVMRMPLAPPSGPPSIEPTSSPATSVLEDWRRAVARTPQAVAVVDEAGACTTYAALDRAASDLAADIRAAGVSIGDFVIVLSRRDPLDLVAMLALFKAGAVYVPLEADRPAEQVAQIAADSRPALLLADRRPAGMPSEVPLLDPASPRSTRHEGSLPQPAPELPAYLIYTSGSSGPSKGVWVAHGTLVEHCRAAARRYDIVAADRVLQFTGAGFDPALEQVWAALTSGASVVLRGPDPTPIPRFSEFLERHRISVMNLPPTYWHAWMRHAREAEQPPQDLRLCILGGEAPPPESAELWESWCGSGIALINAYGPTEAVITASSGALRAADPITLGTTLPGRTAQVWDRYGTPQPAGVPGELVLAGTLAIGYLNRPRETAEAFVPDPFGGRPGARCYRSGDRVRRDSRGRLHYLGRLDRQVKIRGIRIEPGQVEAACRACTGVRDALVIRLERDPDVPVLAAYVVLEPAFQGRADWPQCLRNFLKSRCTPAMIPAVFTPIETLPTDTRGKVDARLLPPPQWEPQRTTKGTEPPNDPIELALQDIWCEALGCTALAREDDFFERGGHSLLGLQVIHEVSRRLGVSLSLRQFFVTPTLAQMARHLRTRGAMPTGDSADIPALRPDPERRFEPFPMTEMQQAYWMGRKSAFTLGNVAPHGYVELEGQDLDVDRLEAAMQRLVARHDMLRAVVTAEGEQRVLPSVPPFRIQRADLRGRKHAHRASALAEIREHMSHHVFDPERWPLMEVRASLLDGGRTRLHFSFDAIIADAASMILLGRELSQLYQNPDSHLPDLTLTFRDCVLAETETKRNASYDTSLAYWRDRLADLPAAPALPLAVDPATIDRPHFVSRRHTMPRARWQRLKALGAGYNLSPSGLLLAAFARVLAMWSEQPRFTLNLTLFNRPPHHPEIDRVLGDFTTGVLVACEPYAEPSFGAGAQRLQRQLWSDLDHRQVSSITVMREWSRRHGGRPLVLPVVFTSTLGLQAEDTQAIPEWLDEVFSVSQTPQVWLDHQVTEQHGDLSLNWDAVESLFPPDMVDDMFASYTRLLDRLALDASLWTREPLSVPLPRRQAARREQANDTARAEPGLPLHGPLIHRALENPDAPAVLDGDHCLTRGQLLHRARLLAHRLKADGACPNQLVAIVMHKGWEQVVAALAVLLADAAYLPIDASLPPHRIARMLEIGRVRQVLVQPDLEADHHTWPAGLRLYPVAHQGAESAVSLEVDLPRAGAEDLAYVIFTSGSTGDPKGVMIRHRAAINTVMDINRRFQIDSDDRVLGISSLSFDLSVWDIFGVLGTGGQLVLPGTEPNPAQWMALLERHGVTIWNSVPALGRLLVEYQEEQAAPDRLPLRLAMFSGDWIPPDLVPRLQRFQPDLQAISLGGATEASIWSIFHPIAAEDAGRPSIPYGKPLANQRFHVFDQNLAARPDGVGGDLYIAGVGLADGYWQDPEKTAASFLTHPETGERLYRTGDLARYFADGNLEFLGRADFQVKINGFRVELGEIETVLTAHPDVKSAAVVVSGNRFDGKSLVAHVVPQEAVEAIRAGDTAEPSEREAELAAYKLGQPGLSGWEPDWPSVSLRSLVPAEDDARYLQRASHRHFATEPLPVSRMAELLACLDQRSFSWRALPKYRYPSAGSLYAVRAHLWVRGARIAGLDPGWYVHDPREGRLVRRPTEADGEAQIGRMFTGTNAPIFASAAFALVLAADREVVAKIYGSGWRDLCLVECGAMVQSIMEQAAHVGLGTCPIGGFDEEKSRILLDLDERYRPLHAMLGGALPAQPASGDLAEATDAAQLEEPVESTGSTPTDLASRLSDHLGERLPTYMVPNHWMFADRLPLTANGKVDRKALPAPENPVLREAEEAPPRPGLEMNIATFMAELLQRDLDFGRHTGLFALGGDSLTAVRLARRIGEARGIDLSVRVIYDRQTAAALTEHVTALELAARTPIAPEEDDDREELEI